MRLKLLVAAVVVLSLLVIWRMMSGGSSPADSLNTRMAELHRTGDVEALAVEAASPDIRTALRAVETMGYVGPKAVKQLRRALADRRPQIRQQAATAYAKVAGPKEVAPLVEIARADESSIVRACAITTLGKVRAHNEMETILDALNDKDLVVRRRAYDAVTHILGRRYLYDPAAPSARRLESIAVIRKFWSEIKGVVGKYHDEARKQNSKASGAR